jgi:hypothetical protein
MQGTPGVNNRALLYYCPAELNMKSSSVLLAVLFLAAGASADEATFRDIQFPSATGSLTSASLAFNDKDKQVIVRVSDGRLFTVGYDQIEKISYEYTKKHRMAQGAGIAMLSPATGAIIAFTKSRNHWLEFDFRDQGKASALILKLNKKDYHQVCEAARAHTGKKLEMLGKTDSKSIKAKIK